ncbi:MAG: PAS domain-containing protein [Candidatus Omnitrophica bacterium]|jgi:PAS domain S-box-containing protein|nr:PAS domain-containing protein [Candidatus Omnitrophota bacterium]
MKAQSKKQKEQLNKEIKKINLRLKKIKAEGFLYSEEDLIIQDKLEYAESIIATVREPLVVLDNQLRVISASKSFYEVFKTMPENTAMRFIYDLGDQQWDIPELRKLLNEILPKHKIIHDFRVNHCFPVIGKRSMVLNAEWIPREAVQPQLILLAIEDVTEWEKVEASLRDSQMKVRAVFDQTFQFIGLMNNEGIVLEANKSALEFAGINSADVINKPFWETVWWAHSKQLQEKLREATKKAAAGEFIRFEATHMAKDGSLRNIDFSLKPAKDESGKVIFLIPEGRDITDRKKLEEALRESYAELELRVRVRTAELSKANDDLQNEISQRRQVEEELKKRMQDLHIAQKEMEKANWELKNKINPNL